jgi:hypothetical protein
MGNACKISIRKPERKRLEDLVIGDRIMLKWLLKK